MWGRKRIYMYVYIHSKVPWSFSQSHTKEAHAWTYNWTCSCKTLPQMLFLEGQENLWFPSFQLSEQLHYKNTPYGSAEEDGESHTQKDNGWQEYTADLLWCGDLRLSRRGAGVSAWGSPLANSRINCTTESKSPLVVIILQTNKNISMSGVFRYKGWCYRG